jgi:hypothetical protein
MLTDGTRIRCAWFNSLSSVRDPDPARQIRGGASCARTRLWHGEKKTGIHPVPPAVLRANQPFAHPHLPCNPMNQSCTRVTYSPDRVSTRTVSPTSTNKGTLTLKPVSVVTFLVAPVAVSPATAISASVTSWSTLGGSS